MSIDYVRRAPRHREPVAQPEPLPIPVAEPDPAAAEAVPAPLAEPDDSPEPDEAAAGCQLMPATQVASVLALCVSAGLAWFHLTGWAWLAGAVALLLSRRFWGVVRFIAAYQALRVVRAISVRTARRRGELRGRAGSVTDPKAPWRLWLEQD